MSRVEVRPEPGCLEDAELGSECEEFRDWLAALALGEAGGAGDGSARGRAGARAAGAAVSHAPSSAARPGGAHTPAAHARRCRRCDAYADDVAACRRWLLEPVTPPAPVSTRIHDRALAVQLRARLARDLLRRSRRETPRERDAIHDDLARWRWIAAQLGEATSAPARVERALDASPPQRAHLLALAARLDPFGLDIALAWIGWLLHAGRRERADRFADRLANELPERGA